VRVRRDFPLPLKVKLSLLITSLVALAVLAVGLSLLRRQEQALTEAVTERGRVIAANLAAGGKSALATNDELALHIQVRDAMRLRDVAYVVFADEKGIVRAHSDVTAIGRTVIRPSLLKQPTTGQLLVQRYKRGDAEIIDISIPLVFSKTPLGTLYVGFGTGSISAAVNKARKEAGVITAVMVIVGLIGAVVLATLLARPIHRLVEATDAVAQGDLSVSVPVTTRDELGVLTESFNRMARSLREKEMIKRAFSRYVAPEIAEEVLKDPEHAMLTGERRQATVLFCDIRGFTSMSERLTPEQVVSLLNDFYTLMVETVSKHDGSLQKFLGDAVLAVFGAPIAHPDHAARAVLTALDMRAAVADLAKRRRAQGLAPFEVGIGVSVGEVIAGTVGTEERMEYTVIGDSVNVASRLQDRAKPGSILLSRRTYDAVRDVVDAKSLGAIKVKGKEAEVDVYEVRGLCAH
jgi:adenylate cyclase